MISIKSSISLDNKNKLALMEIIIDMQWFLIRLINHQQIKLLIYNYLIEYIIK